MFSFWNVILFIIYLSSNDILNLLFKPEQTGIQFVDVYNNKLSHIHTVSLLKWFHTGVVYIFTDQILTVWPSVHSAQKHRSSVEVKLDKPNLKATFSSV